MKTSLIKTLLITVVSLSIFSCGGDDEKPANKFNYKSKGYSLKAGVVDYDASADDDEFFYHDVILYGDGFTITNHEINGKGNAFVLGILSGTASLDAGVYNYNENEDTQKAGELASAGVFVDFNSDTQVGTSATVDNPKVTIKKSGDTYTIDAEYTVDGKVEKAHFSGKLPAL